MMINPLGKVTAMLFRRVTWCCFALVLAALVGCTAEPSATPTSAPSGQELMTKVATAARTVTSAHFTIGITGTLPDVTVQSADGVLTSAGAAQGKFTIKQFGQLIEGNFVMLEKNLYLQVGTGGYTKIDAALASAVYDPTLILNPDKGIANVATNTSGVGAVTESGDSYVATGRVPKDVAAILAPGITADVDATWTVDKASSQPRSVALALTGSDGKPATITLTLTDLNVPATITAPPS
jgi:lipoprotein LprG